MFSPELDALLAQLTGYGYVETYEYRALFTGMTDGLVVTDAVRQAVLCALVNSLVPKHFFNKEDLKSRLDELTDDAKDALPAMSPSTASQLNPELTQAVTETYSLFKVALNAAHKLRPEHTNKSEFAGQMIAALISKHAKPLENDSSEALES